MEMTARKLTASLIALFLSAASAAGQMQLKTEYIGASGYKDEENRNTGGRGCAWVHSAGLGIPVSLKRHDDNRTTAWMVTLSGSYTRFDNRDIPRELSPERMLNTRAGALHIRPFREKWSFMASLGAGIYSPHTRLGSLTMDQVLFDGAAAFLWHLRPNLDIGFGLAFNNSFGFPMAFPAFLLRWELDGRFELAIQMMDAASVTAGTRFGSRFKLGVTWEANGSMAREKIGGKRWTFTHSYMVAGLKPEIRIGKAVTIPLVAGITAERTAYYERSSLKAFFKSMSREYNPGYKTAPYFSAAVRVGF